MNTFFTYLLESSICLICFYCLFFFLLKKETWFQWNRLYLMSSVLISLLIPVFNYTVNVTIDAAPILNFDNNIAPVISPNPIEESFYLFPFIRNNFLQIISCIYVIGFLFSTLVFIKSLLQIFSFYLKGKKERKEKVTHVLANERIGMFSFFNCIFLDQNKFSEFSNEEKERIINHELAHINEKHSWDLMLLELVKIVFWFNPIVYAFKYSIEEIHEFIADELVIRKEGKAFEYAHFLVNQVKYEFLNNKFCNSLFNEPIKNRLIMIKKTKSRNLNSLKFLSAFPVLGGLVFFICVEYAFVSEKNSDVVNSELKNNSIMLDTVPPKASQMPFTPEKGKCYAKCELPAEYLYVEMEYPVYTGNDSNIALDEISISEPSKAKWVKKKTDKPCHSEDPADCMVWCLVETGSETKVIKVVKDINSTKDYEMKSFQVAQIKSDRKADWQEVLCFDKITEDVINQVQGSLKSLGYTVGNSKKLDKVTKKALHQFQDDFKLPKGNLNMATLDKLGLSF